MVMQLQLQLLQHFSAQDSCHAHFISEPTWSHLHVAAPSNNAAVIAVQQQQLLLLLSSIILVVAAAAAAQGRLGPNGHEE